MTKYEREKRRKVYTSDGVKLVNPKKKGRYQVWYAQPNSEEMPTGWASFTISGLKTDTIYERDSLAANIERFLNSLGKKK